MKKTLIIMAAITSALISGCASQPSSTFEPFHAQNLNGLLSSGQYVQKVDNFFVINDSSESMTDKYIGAGYQAQPSPTQLSVEKEILKRINLTIPDLKLTSSIRSFGFGSCIPQGFTHLNLAPTSYSKSVFSSGIDTLSCAGGGSPMGRGIEGTAKDLSTTTGNIAVLILSDGYQLDSDPVAAIKALKQQYGDRLCVYSVWVGSEKEKAGQTLLNQLSDIAGCGFGTSSEQISSTGGMADFVQKVFLKGGALDCSKLDDDFDGINNCNDKCPNTLKGAHVSRFGCWIIDVKFDNDKSNIKPKYYRELDNAVSVIKHNPTVNIEVQGHTSNTGSAEYNQKLSEHRALAVKDYLIHNSAQGCCAHAGRTLTARGYGLTQPMDTNETEEGRANNRRVQLEVIKTPKHSSNIKKGVENTPDALKDEVKKTVKKSVIKKKINKAMQEEAKKPVETLKTSKETAKNLKEKVENAPKSTKEGVEKLNDEVKKTAPKSAIKQETNKAIPEEAKKAVETLKTDKETVKNLKEKAVE